MPWSDSRVAEVIVLYEAINKFNIVLTDADFTLIAIWVGTGKRPDLSVIPPDTPAELIDIMKRCWDGEPSKRPRFQGKVERLFISFH